MGRRKPKTLRISGAAKRRRRREERVDYVEKTKKSNHTSHGERRMKSEIHVISPNKCISTVDNNYVTRGVKRKHEEKRSADSVKNTSTRTEKTRRKKMHNSLDSSRFDRNHDEANVVGLLKGEDAPGEIHSESNGVKSSESRKRRRRKKRRTESGASACKVISEKGLERKSSVESLNNDSLVPVVENETGAMEGYASAIPRALRSCSRKKLLVLDLNGLLCDVVHGYPKTRRPHERVGNSAVFKRPFCDDFMKFCCEKFEIGVWSSRLMKNVHGVVDFIMRDIKDNLLFCWDASKCTYTGFMTIEDKKKPLVLKQLKKLWNKEGENLPWEKGDYSSSNTLLLDDSPYKALCNPLHTGVFPYPYHYTDESDNSLGPGGDLRVYLEGLALVDDVQCYVREHPFGRRAITTANSSWKYYEQVINKIKESSANAQ